MRNDWISLEDLQNLRASQATDALMSLWDEAVSSEDVNYYLAIAQNAQVRTNQADLVLQDRAVWAAIATQTYTHLLASGHDFEVDCFMARARAVRYFKGFFSADAEELSNQIIDRINAIVASEPPFKRSNFATTDMRTLKNLRKAKNLTAVIQTLVDELCVAKSVKIETCLKLRETLP